MNLPLPYQIGYAGGKAIGNRMAEDVDARTIEKILNQAQQSQRQEDLDNLLNQVITRVSPENRQAGLVGLQQRGQTLAKFEQEQRKPKIAQQIEKITGIDAKDLTEEQQTALLKSYFDRKKALDVEKEKQLFKTGQQDELLNYLNQFYNTQPQQEPQQFIPGITAPEYMQNQQEASPNISTERAYQLPNEAILALSVKNPALARIMQSQKDAAQQVIENKLKRNQKLTEQERKEQIAFHKESQKYDENLLDKTRIAKNQINTIDNAMKAVMSGNVKPTSIASIFKGFGTIGDKISEAFLNSDEATLLASIPQLLEGWKEIFGVRLSDADLSLLQDKLPSLGKNPAANAAVLKVIKKYADLTLLRSEIARDIKQKNGGLRPLGYADKIEQRFDEMTKPIAIINPNTGNTIEIPAYKLSDAIKAGAKLANE